MCTLCEYKMICSNAFFHHILVLMSILIFLIIFLAPCFYQIPNENKFRNVKSPAILFKCIRHDMKEWPYVLWISRTIGVNMKILQIDPFYLHYNVYLQCKITKAYWMVKWNSKIILDSIIQFHALKQSTKIN